MFLQNLQLLGLKKLLVHCGHSNFYSTLRDIDGLSAEKSVELVNAETREPLMTKPISPYFGTYWSLMKLVENEFNLNE